MTIIVYIILLFIINYSAFKKLEKITNDELFYVLSLDTLSFSLYMFLFMHHNLGISLINVISIILLLYFYTKEERSLSKTALLIFNIYLLLKILI